MVSPILSCVISVPQHIQSWGPLPVAPAPVPSLGRLQGTVTSPRSCCHALRT